MEKYINLGLFILFLSMPFQAFADTEQATSEEAKYIAWATEILNSLDRKTGTITIAEANAVLNVPQSFYYLDAVDTKKVLVDVWGNPPKQETLGMLLPAQLTPFDGNPWAVTIEYIEGGYVSDADADDIDYSNLLSDMKKDTEADSKERLAKGHPGIELVGWASTPFYDKATKKMHWAQEISFDSENINTLDYNIRILGRKGVLVLNFIADIDQKELIDQSLETVLSIADFDQGTQYSDFDPDIDTVAAYGLGALVAGKLTAKVGLIAAVIFFLKKFGIFILIGVGASALLIQFFRKKKQP